MGEFFCSQVTPRAFPHNSAISLRREGVIRCGNIIAVICGYFNLVLTTPSVGISTMPSCPIEFYSPPSTKFIKCSWWRRRESHPRLDTLSHRINNTSFIYLIIRGFRRKVKENLLICRDICYRNVIYLVMALFYFSTKRYSLFTFTHDIWATSFNFSCR